MHTCIYIYTYMCVSIYIYRERERLTIYMAFVWHLHMFRYFAYSSLKLRWGSSYISYMSYHQAKKSAPLDGGRRTILNVNVCLPIGFCQIVSAFNLYWFIKSMLHQEKHAYQRIRYHKVMYHVCRLCIRLSITYYVPDQSSYVSCDNYHLKFDLVLMIITPSSHSKNSLSKICSKGWVAQKPFVDR